MTAELIEQPKSVVTGDGYWGLCPHCKGESDLALVWRDLGRDHILCCDEHKVAWRVGSNLFSNWRNQTPEERAANSALLETYRIVKPRHPREQFINATDDLPF